MKTNNVSNHHPRRPVGGIKAAVSPCSFSFAKPTGGQWGRLFVAFFIFLLFPLFVSGCAGRTQPIPPGENNKTTYTVQELQEKYEKIEADKLRSKLPPIEQQRRAFEKDVSKTFHDLDQYEKKISKAEKSRKKRLRKKRVAAAMKAIDTEMGKQATKLNAKGALREFF